MAAGSAQAAETPPFDRVKDGVFAVYDIRDLTEIVEDESPAADQPPPPTRDEMVKQIDSLIRETIGVGEWTTTGGHSAAMQTTQRRMTVKASAEIQGEIAGLLGKLREQRTLAIKTTFSVVDSAGLRPSTLSDAERTGEKAAFPAPAKSFFTTVDKAALPGDAKPVLADSEVLTINGQRIIWLSGDGLPLPTIAATSTVSADRKFVTVSLDVSGGTPGRKLATTLSIPFGQTAAFPLDENATRWLLFTPRLMDRSLRMIR